MLHSQPVPCPPPSSRSLVQISASFNFRGTKQGVFCRMDGEQMFLTSLPRADATLLCHGGCDPGSFLCVCHPCLSWYASPAFGLKSSSEPRLSHYSPSQAQAWVRGEWTEVCLTYRVRTALIPFGWIESPGRLGSPPRSTQESDLSIFKSSSVCGAAYVKITLSLVYSAQMY